MVISLPAGIAPASIRLEDDASSFRPRQRLKLVSAAGFAPAVPWSQAEMLLLHHALDAPAFEKSRGLVLEKQASATLLAEACGRLADPKGLAPSAFPQTTGAPLIELRIRIGGRRW